MKKGWLVAVIPGALALAAIVVVFMLFVIKFMWSWVVPDLFPGAVATGMVAGQITWFTAFKVALVVGILTGFGRAGGGHKDS